MGTRTVTAMIAKSSTLYQKTSMSASLPTDTKNFTLTLNPNDNEYIQSVSINATNLTVHAFTPTGCTYKFNIATTLTTSPKTSGQATKNIYTNTTSDISGSFSASSTTVSWPKQNAYTITNANKYSTKYSDLTCTTITTNVYNSASMGSIGMARITTAAARTFTFTLVTASTLTISNPASGGTAKATRVDGTDITTSNDVIYQDSVTLSATPAAHYQFSGWQSSPEVTITSNAFTMPDNDVTITPVFELIGHNVTITSVQHGSATASTAIGDAGETITLTATPDYGYRLNHWESSPEVTFTGDTFVMPNSDITITPVFERYIFDITIATVQHGYATASQSEAAIGTVITLQDFPDTNFRFVSWESAPQVTFTDNTFVMPNSDVTITPIFMSCAGYYNGSAFVPCVPMYYDGTNWIECEWKYYNGTTWIDADST